MPLIGINWGSADMRHNFKVLRQFGEKKKGATFKLRHLIKSISRQNKRLLVMSRKQQMNKHNCQSLDLDISVFSPLPELFGTDNEMPALIL